MRTISLVQEFYGLHYLQFDPEDAPSLFQQEYKVEIHAAGPGLTNENVGICLDALRKAYTVVIQTDFHLRMFVGAGDVKALAYYKVYRPGSGLILLNDTLSPQAVGRLLLTHAAASRLHAHNIFVFQVVVRRSDKTPEAAKLNIAACWALYEQFLGSRLTSPQRLTMLAPWTKEDAAHDDTLAARRRRFNGGNRK